MSNATLPDFGARRCIADDMAERIKMPRGQRRRTAKIKSGTFATVIRAYLASPKFAALARSKHQLSISC